MGSAVSSVMGGGGGGGIGEMIGGIVGGMFGGPIGAMIGQAVGGMLEQAAGDATKGAANQLQQEHGMPKFLADEIKQKVDEVMKELQASRGSAPADAQQAAQDQFGQAINDFQKQFQDQLVKAVLAEMRGDSAREGESSTSNGGGKAGKAGASGGASASSGGGGGGWLQAIAKAMGTALGEKASKMVELSDTISKLQQKGKEDMSQAEQQQNASDVNLAMTEFQATSQEFGMLNNVFSTAIKSLGEALSSMARKQ